MKLIKVCCLQNQPLFLAQNAIQEIQEWLVNLEVQRAKHCISAMIAKNLSIILNV
jgi:hypothetical protein